MARILLHFTPTDGGPRVYGRRVVGGIIYVIRDGI
jgi:hypothetical protein